MPGGIWTSQNKVRPGAYINFEGEPQTPISIGERGIAALTMPLSWGAQGEIIDITALDLLDGSTLKKVGLVYSDSDALLLRLALANCALLKVYNSRSGGAAATTTIDVDTGTGDGLTVTAKYNGTFGNKITIKITVSGTNATVETYADSYFVDRQIIPANDVTQLVANDYVTFSGSGTLVTAEATLEDGTNGNAASSLYTNFFNALRNETWNTVAITSNTATDITLAISTIQNFRENEGMYVQGVVANSSDANYEGIINVVSGVNLVDGTQVTAEQFTAWVAGATAGAYLTESLTGKVVEGAVSVRSQLTNAEIIAALQAGKFVLAVNQNGTIRVEKDINSWHNVTATKGYTFSKNRVIRELDEIGSSIKNIWETTYLGKVSNNESGRMLFKSSIINYLNSLENTGAITDFDPATVTVQAGDAVDSVLATIAVKPVDSMEFLYMTVTIS